VSKTQPPRAGPTAVGERAPAYERALTVPRTTRSDRLTARSQSCSARSASRAQVEAARGRGLETTTSSKQTPGGGRGPEIVGAGDRGEDRGEDRSARACSAGGSRGA